MKKLVVSVCILLSVEAAKAQFTKLLDFSGTNGEQPFGSVILSDNDSVLYGMTNGGNPNNTGVVYSINTDGTGYQNVFSFVDSVGTHPYGSLIRSGNVLYGVTSGNGALNGGTIFSVHTDGSNFTLLHSFDGGFTSTSSAVPNGTLLLVGNVLYGTTSGPGGPHKGGVFSINTDGSGYANLHEFSGSDGQQPGYGALVESNGKLYGTTLYGGTGGLGVVYSIDTNGTNFTKLLDFNTANGSMPFSSLLLIGNKLYGTTNGGGDYDKGIVFSLNTDGSGFTKLVDFDITNGQSPNGALLLSGGTLYGATAGGGTYSFGTLFSVDTSGNNFQRFHNFNTPNGTQPRATLSMADGVLYGTAVVGGAYGKGTVYKYTIQPPVPSICLVTVDTSYTHNLVVWEKTGLDLAVIDSFVVYREITTNNYQPVGAVGVDSLSVFNDIAANPATTGYRYKLKSKTAQGAESTFSDYHNTIYLTNNGGNFSWTPYQIENNTTPVSAYDVYRDDNSSGNFQLIGSTTGNQFGYTDVNFSSYPFASYYVEAIMSGGSCAPTRSAYNGSRSNVKYFGSTNLEGLLAQKVNVYPNPANNTLNIIGIREKTKIQIYDVLGKRVFADEIEMGTPVNTSGLKNGMYTVSIENKGFKKHIKVIVSH